MVVLEARKSSRRKGEWKVFSLLRPEIPLPNSFELEIRPLLFLAPNFLVYSALSSALDSYLCILVPTLVLNISVLANAFWYSCGDVGAFGRGAIELNISEVIWEPERGRQSQRCSHFLRGLHEDEA